MARPKLVLDLRIILGALISVLDQQRDRRSRRHLFAGVIADHHAGQDLDCVGLLPLGGEARLSRAAAIEIALDFIDTQGIRGGQPSTTQPIAGPWLSPKVVTRNNWPKVLKDIANQSIPVERSTR